MKLSEHQKALGNCTYCPKLCRFSCPVAEAEKRETVTPWFKMTMAEMVRQGRQEAGGAVGELFLHCLTCLQCRTNCKHENDVPEALIAARRATLESGGEAPMVAGLLDRIRDSGNPWGEDLSALLHQGLDRSYFVSEAQAVVFAGCRAIRSVARHLAPLFRLLQLMDVDYVGVFHGEALCCGAPLWQAGDEEGFKKHARKLVADLAGVRTVICPCPTCAWYLSSLATTAGVGLSARVVTLDQFLAPLVASRPPRRKLPDDFACHDPCYMTRFLERGKSLRDLLERVLEKALRESVWTGSDGLCCGGGGLVPHTLPQVATDCARRCMEQLELSGASRVVTACPGCVDQLEGVGSLPVADLVQVLLESYS